MNRAQRTQYLVPMRHVRGARRAWKMSGMVALVGGVSLLSACAQSYPSPRAPDGDPIEAAQALSDAPDVVRASGPQESCGAFVLGQGETVPTDAVECLSAAVSSGEPAELAWSLPTTEGDPIVSFASAGIGPRSPSTRRMRSILTVAILNGRKPRVTRSPPRALPDARRPSRSTASAPAHAHRPANGAPVADAA